MDLKKINLLELPLERLSGEFVKLNENKHIIFPQILDVFDTPYSLSALEVYDGYYLNDKLIYIYKQLDGDKVLYNLNQEILTQFYKGFCVFGDVFFVFYSDKCLVINTGNNTVKTVSITIDNAPMNILLVRQLTPQLFAILTSNPTTVFLFGLDSAGAIASADNNSTVNINSFTFASFSNPIVNVDLIYYDKLLYLFGDDYTVVLKLEIKDIIYLQTVKSFNYRYTPFQSLEEVGIKFVRETQSFYVFYNTLHNTYLYITKDMKNTFFGKDTVFLQPNICFKQSDNRFYKISSDILQSNYKDVDNYHEISFRLNLPYTVMKNAFVLITEVQKSTNIPTDIVERIASLVIEARYDNGYNIWSYGILYNKNNYRILARGTDFVITLYSKKFLRLEEFELWVSK
jgi:hypothetical protein